MQSALKSNFSIDTAFYRIKVDGQNLENDFAIAVLDKPVQQDQGFPKFVKMPKKANLVRFSKCPSFNVFKVALNCNNSSTIIKEN